MADTSPHSLTQTPRCLSCGEDLVGRTAVHGKCSPCFFAEKNNGLPEEWKKPNLTTTEEPHTGPELAALKYDSGKLPLSLLPSEALEEIAKVLQHGAEKYAAHNWRKGFVWSRTLDALLRHIYAWQRGEDIDPDSGLNHLAHAGCNVLFLLSFIRTSTGLDDRYKICTPSPDMESDRTAIKKATALLNKREGNIQNYDEQQAMAAIARIWMQMTEESDAKAQS